jgi:hypothetical protein
MALQAAILQHPDFHEAVTGALALGNFCALGGSRLSSQYIPRDEIPWEIFRGRLLDARQTRARQVFETWNILMDGLGPLLSIRFSASDNCVHVSRSILCHAWESYDAGGNVIEARETQRWIPELVGSIAMTGVSSSPELTRELSALIFRALIGLSKLPLHSVEAPLPAYSFGKLAYIPTVDSGSEPIGNLDQVIGRLNTEQTWLAKAKLLEFVLRAASAEQIEECSKQFMRQWLKTGHRREDLPKLVRTLFNEISLSPYTAFVPHCLALVRALVNVRELSIDDAIDLLGFLLRQSARHLTAYDLIRFHHSGANYPDALLLDAVLREYLRNLDKHPDRWTGDSRQARMRRRALRQGWLLRRLCEGLPVPNHPTSPGENLRVLPSSFERIAEEQFTAPGRRPRLLFADEPLKLGELHEKMLRQSFVDLESAAELRELGLALFLDRPLGQFKQPGELDLTPLFSYETFSRSIAEGRLMFLAQAFPGFDPGAALLLLDESLVAQGIPLRHSGRPPAPGTVSLDDCFRAADDFVILSSTASSIGGFLESFDVTPLREWIDLDQFSIIVSADAVEASAPGVLRVYDRNRQPRVELRIDREAGYKRHLDREIVVGGLHVTRLWDPSSAAITLPGAPITLKPRF